MHRTSCAVSFQHGANSELYSNYEGTTTFKELVGIAPSGAMTFVSSLYAGSISDKHITRVWEILDLLESGDEVWQTKVSSLRIYSVRNSAA